MRQCLDVFNASRAMFGISSEFDRTAFEAPAFHVSFSDPRLLSLNAGFVQTCI